MYKKIIGANIKKYRKAKHLTQEQAAEKCGISSFYFCQIEQGHKRPALDTFINIAEGLDASLDQLVSGYASWTENVKTCEILENLEQLPKSERMEALDLFAFHINQLKKRVEKQSEK